MRRMFPEPTGRPALTTPLWHQLLWRLCAALVVNKSELSLDVTTVGDLTNIVIGCAADDGPRLVGRRGTIFRALRWITGRMSQRIGQRLNLDTVSAEKTGEPCRLPPFSFNPDWPADETTRLLGDTVEAVFDRPASLDLFVGGDDPDGEKRARWTITPSHLERRSVTEDAAVHLSTLFNAVSTTNGCRSSVAIMTNENAK